MIIRLGTKADIEQTLELQHKYLITNTSESEKEQGFVTTPFTADQLTEIINFGGFFVTENTTKHIVAYVVVCSWEFFTRWPTFKYMASRFPKLNFKGQPVDVIHSFEYGPICIDKDYRNSDVLLNLFETMRLAMKERFPLGITFINKLNKRSFAAHTKKLNLTVIDEFSFNGHNYYSLAFNTNESVL